MTLQTVLLDSFHIKDNFCCGKDPLDRYIQRQASQDIEKRLAVCFVLAEEGGRVKGYYTLSNDSVHRDILPEGIRKKMPPVYENLPVTLLGRLAVDKNFANQGLGEFLLMDALRRASEISTTAVGSMAVVVDPIDHDAKGFYKKYQFIDLPIGGRMFLPMKTIRTLF